jgi:hypothetical protein
MAGVPFLFPNVSPDSDEMNFAMELHEINLSYTYDMIQQRIRSIKESAKFDSEFGPRNICCKYPIRNTRAPKWRGGLWHCISVLEVLLQTLVRSWAVSHLAVIVSPIGQRPIGWEARGRRSL